MISNNTLDDYDELLDIVDSNDIVIGQKKRSYIYNGSNYRVVNVFIRNDAGQLWIPRRSSETMIFPLCLDASVGGHVKHKESYDDAFVREVREELNIDVNKVNWECIGYVTPHKHNVSAYMKVYEIRSNKTPKYNVEDICEGFWMFPKDVLDRLSSGDVAKSDLQLLVKLFYLPAQTKNTHNGRILDLSLEELPKNLNQNWISEYHAMWQDIKAIDYKNQVQYPENLDWATYYSIKAEERFGGYKNYHARRMIENFPFYDLLFSLLQKNDIALEVGLGAGTGIIELAKHGYLGIGSDYYFSVLELFENNLRKILPAGKPHSVQADLFHIPLEDGSINLGYSHGTLEHFSEKEILNALKEILRVCQKFILVIPTDLAAIRKNRYELKLSSSASGGNFGDEYLYSIEIWENLIDYSGGKIIYKGGYWIPKLGSKTAHPIDATAYYGLGIYAIYIILPMVDSV